MRKYEALAASLEPGIIRQYPHLHRVKPFKVAGSVYYVGNKVCSSHLVDTGDGLLLIDTPFARQLPLLLQSIWEAGFDPANIRYILHTHAHADHVGATPALVSMFGCRTCISAVDAANVEANPRLLMAMDDDPGFFVPDVRLHDGENICLGNTCVRAVATPGHTQGAMSYFFSTSEAGRHLICGILGGTGFNTLCHDYFTDYGVPSYIRSQFMDSLEMIRGEKVDVMLGNNPGANATFEKLQRHEACEADNPFIDPGEWRRYIDEVKRRFILFRAEDDAMNSMPPLRK